jgi:hypothetical protein
VPLPRTLLACRSPTTGTGAPGVLGIAELMPAGVQRGSDKCDYWSWIELPIDAARRRLSILAKGVRPSVHDLPDRALPVKHTPA